MERRVVCALIAWATLVTVADCSGFQSRDRPREIGCSKTCVAVNCNSVGIRYGKFCGVGWSGCPGERPCDDLDACCKFHDECVEKKVLLVCMKIKRSYAQIAPGLYGMTNDEREMP